MEMFTMWKKWTWL